MSQIQRKDSVGKNFFKVFPAATEPTSKYWIEYHRAMKERAPVFFEEQYTPQGIWTSVNVYPTPDGGLAVFFRDVTAQKNVQTLVESEKQKFEAIFVDSPASMALLRGPTFIFEKVNPKYKELMARKSVERLAENLQHAVNARDDFLSIASHELKTPLTSLMPQTQMLKRQIAKNDPAAYSKPRVDQLAEQTDKQTLRLVRLVDDMLDIARIRSGKLTLQPEAFNLCDLVQDAASRMHAQFVDAGCGDPKLILCAPAHGTWDRMRLEQVLNNLFTNAIRYGKGEPVEVAVECLPGHVRLVVKDHGIGIAPEAQPKIFDRFERAVDANEVSGLGLGLFITRQIVRAHGGTITVKSELGQGATLTIDLPLKTPQMAAQEGVHVL